MSNATLYVGGILIGAILACCTFLVAIDKLDAELMMAVVVGPIVGGIVAHVAGAKGVQAGAQAAISPPPDA